jgi:hypothetical protein
VKVVKTLLGKKIKQLNRGQPCNFPRVAKQLKKGESTLWRKKNILLQMCNDKRKVRIIPTVHREKTINMSKDKKIGGVKKCHCIVQYKYMKRVHRTDQDLSYYSIMKRTVK